MQTLFLMKPRPAKDLCILPARFGRESSGKPRPAQIPAPHSPGDFGVPECPLYLELTLPGA